MRKLKGEEVSMENIVEAKKLTKRYGNFTALQQVNLTIKRGEIYGLVGANGAGKTTFMKMITGQIFPSEGELSLFGAYNQKEQEKQRKRLGEPEFLLLDEKIT